MVCCYRSVTKSCPTVCNPVDYSTPGFPILHCLPEFAQIHVHWVTEISNTSSSATPFSFCLQPFPASGSFPVSWLFTSGGQSIGTSASASILPMNIQGWFPLGLSGLISLQSKGLSRVFSDSSKASILCHSAFFTVQLSCTSIHDYWKNHSFDRMELCWQSNVSAFEYAF